VTEVPGPLAAVLWAAAVRYTGFFDLDGDVGSLVEEIDESALYLVDVSSQLPYFPTSTAHLEILEPIKMPKRLPMAFSLRE